MRGRKPKPLKIAPADAGALQTVAHSSSLPWFQVQRAKMVLAMAAGEPHCSVATRLECDPATVWRVSQRYRQGDLAQLLADGRQGNSPGWLGSGCCEACRIRNLSNQQPAPRQSFE